MNKYYATKTPGKKESMDTSAIKSSTYSSTASVPTQYNIYNKYKLHDCNHYNHYQHIHLIKLQSLQSLQLLQSLPTIRIAAPQAEAPPNEEAVATLPYCHQEFLH